MRGQRTGLLQELRAIIHAHPGLTKHELVELVACDMRACENALGRGRKDGDLVCIIVAENKRNRGRWYAACNAPGPDGKPRPTSDGHALSRAWPIATEVRA